MNRTPNSSWRSWAQLDIAQFPTWPSGPRRFLLALLTLLAFVVICAGWLLPMWRTLLVAHSQTQSLQQQYKQITQNNAQQSRDASGILAQGVTPIAASDTAGWLAQLIEISQSHQLRNISLTPVDLGNTTKSNQPNINETLATRLARDPLVGQITLVAEGRYPDILAWTDELSAHNEIISIENMTLVGANDNNIKVQIQLFFIKAPTP